MTHKKPVLLLILDGWGIRPDDGPGNAIALAQPARYEQLLTRYPHIAIGASEEYVGLPKGQIGNSEVGHLNMGAGRVVYQEITRIDKAIEEGTFFKNDVLLAATRHAKQNNSVLHIMGLVSDGGVHSSMHHLMALLDLAKQQEVSEVRVHAFLDGRDVPPKSAEKYLRQVEEKLLALDYPQIATISGRFYAMDRDKRWDRTQRAYENLTSPTGEIYQPLSLDALQSSYNKNINDEFVEPAVSDITFRGIQDNDAVVFFNFRPDRARQLTNAFTQQGFDGFKRQKTLKNLYYGCLTLYDETFNLPIAFPKQRLDRILAEVLSQHGKTQFRTAETEKYAHVTFFFNGGFETPYPGEDRLMVPSPKVHTYDEQPEMSITPVTDGVVTAIESGKYDFIVVNFANPDMIGHTGMLNPAIEAIKAVDESIGRVVDAVLEADGVMMLTADHGNIEKMIDEDGGPHTAHTTELVPFVLISNSKTLKLATDKTYSLSCIAPTVLDLLGVEKPAEMTSSSLLVSAKTPA